MITWIQSHPWVFAAMVAITVTSILNLIVKHWGPRHPGLKKVLVFIIDLLALVPNRDSTFRGLQVPGLSVSKADKE